MMRGLGHGLHRAWGGLWFSWGRRKGDSKAPVVLWSGWGVGRVSSFPSSLISGRCVPQIWADRRAFLSLSTPQSCGPLSSCVCVFPERVFGVMCTYACVCPQSSVALGLHWGRVSLWLPACGQLWEQRGWQVGPWFGKVCTVHCILILHL